MAESQEHAIWTEKYRPQDFSEVKGQKEIVARVKAFVQQKNMPHQLYSGPAGVGKCVTGETPILTGSGKLIPIEDCFRNNEKEVMTLGDDGKIKKEKIAYLLQGSSDKLIKVKTALGKYIKTTPEHPFLVLKEGVPHWIKAENLGSNDLVATPLEICVEEKTPLFELGNVPGLWGILKKDIEVNISDIFIGTEQHVLRYLEKQKQATNRKISENTQIKKNVVAWATRRLVKKGILSKNGSKSPIYTLLSNRVLTKEAPFGVAKKIGGWDAIKYIYYRSRLNQKSSKIPYFREITPKFLEWLGMVFGDGHIDRERIQFTNKNEQFLQHFKSLSEEIFGNLNWCRRETRKVPSLEIGKARTISILIERLFDIPIDRKKADIIKIPSFLFSADKERISSFIRGYYECDGCFHRGSIEFSSASKQMIYGLSYLLLVFGITSKIRKKKNQFYLTLSGGPNILKFRKEIKPLFKKIKKINYAKKHNTNIDVMEVNRDILNNIIYNLGIKQTDLGRKKEIEFIFERKRASRIKIMDMYKKVCFIARKKISEALKTIAILNNLKTDSIKSMDDIFNNLDSSKIRTKLDKQTGIGYDRLKEYYDRKREPSLNNLMKLIRGLYVLKKTDNIDLYNKITEILLIRERIVKTLRELNISFPELSKNSNIPIYNVHCYLGKNGLSYQSIKKIGSLFGVIKQTIEQRVINTQLIADLEIIDFLSKAQVMWDKVKSVEQIEGDIVYDLNIENTHNFVGGHGALILHNSTLAIVVAKKLFGAGWRQNFLELNASDERGIDIVRVKVKDFARTKAIGDVPFKIIFLDECDALTREAQQALRRTMENYTTTCRFILSCNFSSRIIDPIQSRCAIFRFKPLDQKDLHQIIDRISKEEHLKISEKAKEALIEISEGDCRRLENIMQSCAAISKNIDEKLIYSLASVAEPKEVKEILKLAIENKFIEARSKLLDTMLNYGLSGLDVIKQIQKQILDLDVENRAKMDLIEKCGEIEFRMTEGSDEFIQLEALLAQFTLVGLSK